MMMMMMMKHLVTDDVVDKVNLETVMMALMAMNMAVENDRPASWRPAVTRWSYR